MGSPSGVETDFQILSSYSGSGGVHSNLRGIPDFARTFQVFNIDSSWETACVMKQSFSFVLSFKETEDGGRDVIDLDASRRSSASRSEERRVGKECW